MSLTIYQNVTNPTLCQDSLQCSYMQRASDYHSRDYTHSHLEEFVSFLL